MADGVELHVRRWEGDGAPFLLTVAGPDGQDDSVFARAVIDASGTTGTPNPLGAAGVAALGEAAASGHVFYGIPDVLGAHECGVCLGLAGRA